MAFGGIFKKAFTSVKLTKREYDPEIVSINDIKLPIIYSTMDEDRVHRDIKSELQTYKSLGYRFKDRDKLEDKEYYSYQIGILLNALNNEADLKIRRPSEYIPEFIYKASNDTLAKQMSDIVKKFDAEVPKNISDIVARDQFIWTPIEAGYILYYLSIYKDIKVTQ